MLSQSRILAVVVVGGFGCGNGRDAPSQGATDTTGATPTAAALATELGHSVVTGYVHSVAGQLGTWNVTLSDCQTGELNGFYGADFFVAGTTNIRLRYVHDEATGEVLKIFYPDKKDTAAVFDHTDKCTVLEGAVTKMNARTRVVGKGDIRHVEGHVKFDCTYDKDGHVTGEVTFSHCH